MAVTKSPHPERLTEQEILEHLSTHRQPLSLRQIAEALDLSHAGRRDLKKIIEHLARTGAIEEATSGHYRTPRQKSPGIEPGPRAIPAEARGAATTSHEKPATPAAGAAQRIYSDPNRVTGRMVMHRDGYGFLVPDRPVPGIEGDLYIGRDSTGDAMHGDRVLAHIERRKPGGRAEAAVDRIVDRAHPTVVGIFQYGSAANFVRPIDDRLQQEIIIPPGEELTPELRARVRPQDLASAASRRRLRLKELDGAVVDVELTRFPRGGVQDAGRVSEILGRTGDMGVDVEIVIRKHHLPHRFPPEVQEEAGRVPQSVSAPEREGRGDFRHLPIVTIDGETAKDFDDAVYVTRRRRNLWRFRRRW